MISENMVSIDARTRGFKKIVTLSLVGRSKACTIDRDMGIVCS